MHNTYEDLEELCGTVSKELEKANKKLNGNMSAGDVEYLDKLTHMLKSIKTTMAMIDSEEGYSGYTDGNTYASARGRMNAPRDSRGRYSGDYSRRYRGYSRDDGMIEELRGLMENASDDRTRQEFQKFISRIESM